MNVLKKLKDKWLDIVMYFALKKQKRIIKNHEKAVAKLYKFVTWEHKTEQICKAVDYGCGYTYEGYVISTSNLGDIKITKIQ